MTFKRIGYYSQDWSYHDNFSIAQIDAATLDVINYSFASMTDGVIVPGNEQRDLYDYFEGDCWEANCKRGGYNQLNKLKKKHPHLKTMISCGGWEMGATKFSDMALTQKGRTKFAKSAAKYVKEHGFDGIDIDWEFPVAAGGDGGGRPEDKQNYNLFLKTLRETMDEAGKVDGKKYYVTAATSARQSDMVNVEYNNFHHYLDWINLMTYDFHVVGMYYHGSNYNAALYPSPKDPSPEPSKSQDNIDGAVKSLQDFGVPNEKIMVGVGSYGRGWAGVTTPPFSDYTGAPYGTWQPGFFQFTDLKKNYVNKNGFKRHWDNDAKVPWLYNRESRVWITYDDEKSYTYKAEYVVDNQLGGMFMWELDGDKDHVIWNTIDGVFKKAEHGKAGKRSLHDYTNYFLYLI